MSSLKCAVYHPPFPGMPYVAVVLHANGEVMLADSVPSVAAGDALIAEVMARVDADKAAGKFE